MFPGVDPRQLAQMQEVSKFIKGVIKVDYEKRTVELTMQSDQPDAIALIPQLLEQFSNALAQQLSSFFAIQGEIIESGKKT